MTVVDGKVNEIELSVLRELAELCSERFDEGVIRQLARRNRR